MERLLLSAVAHWNCETGSLLGLSFLLLISRKFQDCFLVFLP